jgi:membrane protease YdiL (CAAX protease family)
MSRIFTSDILAGLFFLVVGSVAGVMSVNLPMGTLRQMNSGFFPLMLSIGLTALGLAILVRGIRASKEVEAVFIAWRPLACIIVAVILFGVMMAPLGFIPTLFITVFVTTLASTRYKPQTMLIVSLALTLACYVIFSVGLELPMPLWGTIFQTAGA